MYSTLARGNSIHANKFSSLRISEVINYSQNFAWASQCEDHNKWLLGKSLTVMYTRNRPIHVPLHSILIPQTAMQFNLMFLYLNSKFYFRNTQFPQIRAGFNNFVNWKTFIWTGISSTCHTKQTNCVHTICIIRSKWKSNPYTLGSYSFIPVGAHAEDVQALAEPVLDARNRVSQHHHLSLMCK